MIIGQDFEKIGEILVAGLLKKMNGLNMSLLNVIHIHMIHAVEKKTYQSVIKSN